MLLGACYRTNMQIDCETERATEFPVLMHARAHTFRGDVDEKSGSTDSAPGPHDYFDAALASCKALTVKLYAQKKDIPLTGVTVEVTHDSTEEQKGKYTLNVKLTLKGVLTDEQREELHRVADRCPVHKLMTTAEVTIETTLSEGAFSQ